MWLDITEYCTLWIMLYCGLASLQGVRGLCESCVRNARPDADVLLPCTFPPGDFGPTANGDRAKVLWTQPSTGTILEITQTGHINFSDPREGRVKVFPTLCRLGNCSIHIERLRPSDLGQYCCVLRNRSVCSVVQFSADNADRGEPNEVALLPVDMWFVIGGVGGGFFVLLIICFCFAKFRNRDEYVPDQSDTNTNANQERASEEIVYENDDHDPNGIACVEIKPQQEITSSSTGQKPAALKPFYANQEEIDKQLEKRNRLKKKRLQYENPIYANSQEQLDQV